MDQSIIRCLKAHYRKRYLELSPDVISLSGSDAASKIALSQTFCPVPPKFDIAGLNCIQMLTCFFIN